MRLTVKDLKVAFEASCNRAKNLSLGTSYFQDFEVAHFLNMAYMACIKRRLSHQDERYVSVAHKQGIPPTSAFPNSPLYTIEFGDLYGAVPVQAQADTPSSTVGADTVKEETGGPNTRYFEIADINGFKPYVMNVQLYEFKKAGDPKGVVASFVCKPINVADVPRLALVYQSDKFANYLFFRERKVASLSAVANADPTTKNYIEIVYSKRMNGDSCHISYDYIAIPRPITATEIESEANRAIEVLFGYEIVTMAVEIAMESLGTARGSVGAEQREAAGA